MPPSCTRARSKWMTTQMEIASQWGSYTFNKEIRDLVAIGAACGVTTAFKAPVGGRKATNTTRIHSSTHVTRTDLGTHC